MRIPDSFLTKADGGLDRVLQFWFAPACVQFLAWASQISADDYKFLLYSWQTIAAKEKAGLADWM
jgi:hypothetical protein